MRKKSHNPNVWVGPQSHLIDSSCYKQGGDGEALQATRPTYVEAGGANMASASSQYTAGQVASNKRVHTWSAAASTKCSGRGTQAA